MANIFSSRKNLSIYRIGGKINYYVFVGELMDFQKIVDGFSISTCVISVEKKPNGSYGQIRIVTGNKPYIESIEGVGDAPKMLSNKFVPNSEYQRYFPRDLNFEEFCYRSAVLKQPLHSYVHPDRYDFWFNLFFMPLESDDENIAYCTYSQELTHEKNAQKMSNISYETASDVLSTCIKLRDSDNFEQTMNKVIKDIREICKASYCCVMLMNTTERTCSLLCQDFAEYADFHTNDNWMDEHFYDIAETWESIIGGSNCLILKNLNDMEYVKERNVVWYDSLILSGVESMVLFPLKTKNNLLGYIWATNFQTEHTIRIKETLELTTFFLAAEISNHQLFERFKVMSSIDSLTGVLNRNEMNNRVDVIAAGNNGSKQPLGIVFTDLNGLKKANDINGHLAGDLMLKEAASILRSFFPKDEIYRAGGDEFMILTLGTSKDELEKKVEELKKTVEVNKTVTFAIGCSFDPDSKNILSVMTNADKKMYKDKELFYAEHPEKKRWN